MINYFVVMGNLTRDPEQREGSGTEISTFSLAVNKEASGGREKETYFLDCTSFGKTANFVNRYLHKGSKIVVEGSIRQERWADKETGKQRSKISFIANKVTSLDRKSDQSDTHPEAKEEPFQPPVDEGDIPF